MEGSMPAPVLSKIDGLIVRPSGPWIKRKHHFLNRSCDILTKAMRRKLALTFVDLYAGPGRCLINTTKRDVEGSPVLALQHEFSQYTFVE